MCLSLSLCVWGRKNTDFSNLYDDFILDSKMKQKKEPIHSTNFWSKWVENLNYLSSWKRSKLTLDIFRFCYGSYFKLLRPYFLVEQMMVITVLWPNTKRLQFYTTKRNFFFPSSLYISVRTSLTAAYTMTYLRVYVNSSIFEYWFFVFSNEFIS